MTRRRLQWIAGGLLLVSLSVYLHAAASYPGGVKAFTTKNVGDVVQASHIDDLQDEVTAIEQALLTVGFAHDLFPSTDAARSLGTSSSQWLDIFASRKVRTGLLNFRASTTLTIATGVVTATRSYHAIDTEGAAATDDLDTVTAGTGLEEGAILTLRAANVAHVVTAKDTTGNLLLNGDFAFSATDRTLTLLYDGTNWRELGRSVETSIAGAMTLLHSGSGTDSTVGATNVDTYALASQLTDKDTLYISMTLRSTGAAATIVPTIINSTDTATLATPTSINNAYRIYNFWSRVVVGSPTLVTTVGTGNAFIAPAAVTFTTNFTGAWTIALHHAGITAPDTLVWSWSIYKIAGQ